MGCNLMVSDTTATQVHDDFSCGPTRARSNDGDIRMIGQEAFHVSGVTGHCTDTRSELVNALMGKQTPIFEGYDVFGNVFKLGHHVRRDEKRTPWPTPLHDVTG